MTFRDSQVSNGRLAATLLCVVILAAMLTVTTFASLDRSILNLRASLISDPWFLATLCDAYCGFLIFYFWVVYKERTMTGRFVWFVLIMGLGNIATAIYLLRELWRTKRGGGTQAILLRSEFDHS